MPITRDVIRYDGVLLYESEGGTSDRMLAGEEGFGYPKRNNMIDQIGDPYINLYRRSTSGSRTFTISLQIKAESPDLLLAFINDWEETHATGAERVLKRVTTTGGVYYLDCVPKGPVWKSRGQTSIAVTQGYEAANPWWYGDAVSVVSAFAGVGPVNVPVVNAGNIPSWITAEIVNAVTDPKIAVSTGYFIELDYTNGAGETIDINCRPAAVIEHSVAGDIFGYRTSDSWVNRVQIPVGASNVALTAVAGGVAACTITHTPLYGALS